MPNQIFKITIPPEAHPLDVEDLRRVLEHHLTWECAVQEVVLIPARIESKRVVEALAMNRGKKVVVK